MKRAIVTRTLLGCLLCMALLPSEGRSQGSGKARRQVETASQALLKKVRYHSSKRYTRVILDLSREVRYETHRLQANGAKGLPPRIYVDLIGVRQSLGTTRPIVVQDGLLRQVRVGQFKPDVTRVVLDLNSLSGHKAFLLPDPYRLVIDIQGRLGRSHFAALNKRNDSTLSHSIKKGPKQRRPMIVLDPGHGGKDPGAVGVGGVLEKDIVLSIAKKLARKLRQKMGAVVVLTRQDDSFIPLEDRTAIANAEGADLFISLHTNASTNTRVRGIETYYLNNTDDEGSIRLASRENGTSRKSISDLQFILSDLIQNLKLEDSITLAHHLQSSVVSHVRRKYRHVKDLGVKKALFYVLVGAKMPSILAELLFITNKKEGRALAKRAYKDAIVEGLYQGIKEYYKSTLIVKNL